MDNEHNNKSTLNMAHMEIISKLRDLSESELVRVALVFAQHQPEVFLSVLHNPTALANNRVFRIAQLAYNDAACTSGTNKVRAIKAVRTETSWELREAKEYVEYLFEGGPRPEHL